jgi:Uma2 family endonuclease
MTPSAASALRDHIFYPETDGQPTAENTRQFRWIVTLAGNLAALFRDREDVFVSGNQFWYPREGEPELRVAPDVYVVFGRPKRERASYRQWEEDDVPLTVVFEVLSPGNTAPEMMEKLAFYDEYGVEEYYLYNPEGNLLQGYTRGLQTLAFIREMHGFVSPRLGISFDLSGPELVVRYPDGRPFLTFEELEEQRQQAQQRAVEAERQRDEARQRADQAEQRAREAAQRAARLGELSQKVMSQQATPEEVAELQRLLKEAPPSDG